MTLLLFTSCTRQPKQHKIAVHHLQDGRLAHRSNDGGIYIYYMYGHPYYSSLNAAGPTYVTPPSGGTWAKATPEQVTELNEQVIDEAPTTIDDFASEAGLPASETDGSFADVGETSPSFDAGSPVVEAGGSYGDDSPSDSGGDSGGGDSGGGDGGGGD